MNPSSILIVRGPGEKTGIVRQTSIPSPPCPIGEEWEVLFLDIKSAGKNAVCAQRPEGIALNRQIRQKKGESFAAALERVLKAVVSVHELGIILIHRGGGNGSGWGEQAADIIRDRIPGVQIYEGDPCPGVASQVCPGAFRSGGDLAGYLIGLAEKNMAGGFEFLLGPDIVEKGLQRSLEILEPWMKLKSPAVKFCLHLPVTPDADFHSIVSGLPGLFERGLAMVHWGVTEPGQPLPRELMWVVSKQGIWNHVSGLDLFDPVSTDRFWISNTPNIVHSFDNLGAGTRDQAVTSPEPLLSYGKLPALPGRALWQIVRDPGVLLPCLGKIPKPELLRMRVGDKTGSIFGLGTNLEYFFNPPDQVPGDIMEEIISMVDAGGSVDITHVRANLKQAYLIGYAMENGRVAGNSSLKHPRQIFIDRLRKMTGLDFTNCVERGYTSVRPEYRAMGVGAKLLEGLTARAVDVRIFSIISEDNLATQKIALRNKTRKVTTYFSDKLKKKMGVWMPEHMMPEKWDPDEWHLDR